MTTPAPRPPLAAQATQARAARWIDRLTSGVLALSVGVTAGVTLPALLRVAGYERADSPRSPSSLLPYPGYPGPRDLLGSPDDVAGVLVAPDPEDDGEDLAPPGALELGLTRDALTLHDHPASAAAVTGRLPAGELVTILRVVGDWILVYHTGPAGPEVGYVKKSEVAVR